MLEHAVEEIAKCRAAGHIPTRLCISSEDLQKIGKTRPEVLNGGHFYGLRIELLSKGCPLHVLP